MKKSFRLIPVLLLACFLALPCAAAETAAMDPAVFRPVGEIVAGTYTANNDYGPATLEVGGDGSFTYSFDNSAFGNIVSMVASGTVVDGEFKAEQILNPTMGNFDATDTYNLTEFGYQVKSVYLGLDWSTEAYQAYQQSSIDPELVARIEASRMPTLVVTLVLLVVLLVISATVLYFKYKRRWPPKGTVIAPAQSVPSAQSAYEKHQVVTATLFGDDIPVTFAVDKEETQFRVTYQAMGTLLEGTGVIQEGRYLLDKNAVGFINNMLEVAVPLLTGLWQPGDGTETTKE